MLAWLLASVLRWCAGQARRDEGAQPLQRLGDQGGDPGGGHGEEAGQVLGVPGAGHVGLAEADEVVASEARVELVGTVDVHRRAALAEATARATLDHGDVEAVDGGVEETPGDGGGDRGAGAAAQRLEGGHALRGGDGCALVASVLLEGHRTPSCRWVGRGRIGSRRAHSQMPWARISALPRSAAPRVVRRGTSLRVPVRLALKGAEPPSS